MIDRNSFLVGNNPKNSHKINNKKLMIELLITEAVNK